MADKNKYSQVSPPIHTLTLPNLKPLINQFGLPLHIIFKERINEEANSIKKTIAELYPYSMICFALKSNPCMGAVKIMKELDLGIDAASEFELNAALDTGIPASKIICNGNAKTDDYLGKCIAANVLISLDGQEELERAAYLAAKMSKSARALLRFSQMPLEGFTTADQSTASQWTKFGFSFGQSAEVFNHMKKYKSVEYQGISAHIGTQICELSGYVKLLNYLLELIETADKSGLQTKFVDIGGGFPVSYISKADWHNFQTRLAKQLSGTLPQPEWVSWDNAPLGYAHFSSGSDINPNDWRGKAFWSEHPGALMLEKLLSAESDHGISLRQRLLNLGSPTLIVEPGRSLIGLAGVTVSEVISVKKVLGNWVITLNLGIVNHGTSLISPDIYPVRVLPENSSDQGVEAFLGGRLCFSGDMISKIKLKLNRMPKRGDLMVIYHTGAYCADHFASNSCGYPLPAKVAIGAQGEVEVWRQRQEFSDVFFSTVG